MKIINFTVKQVLPALLDKSKNQTIRKAWKTMTGIRTLEGLDVDIPARYQVGEQVQLMWNQRSQHKYFRKDNGKAVPIHDFKEGMNQLLDDNLFPKKLGEAEIKKVFKIIMGRDELGYFIWRAGLKTWEENELNVKLAKRDGFKSAEQLFKFFDKTHDLSIPKHFWCYRWVWK